MVIFSVTQCAGVSQLVSRFFSEGIDPHVAVCLLYPQVEGESGASYSVLLVFKSLFDKFQYLNHLSVFFSYLFFLFFFFLVVCPDFYHISEFSYYTMDGKL